MRATTDSIMLQSWRRPAKVFSDFNTLQLAGVMSLVVPAPLVAFLVWAPQFHHRSVDLPKVVNAVSMPNADREDAMLVSVTRDGIVYFGAEPVNASDLPQRITNHLRDRSVERKVHIKADARATWGHVKRVLEAVHAAGICASHF